MPNRRVNFSEKISCHYTNPTQQIQIVRVDIGLNECIEKVVFPDKYFDFCAPSDAQMEIHTYAIATAVLSDRIPVTNLVKAS